MYVLSPGQFKNIRASKEKKNTHKLKTRFPHFKESWTKNDTFCPKIAKKKWRKINEQALCVFSDMTFKKDTSEMTGNIQLILSGLIITHG